MLLHKQNKRHIATYIPGLTIMEQKMRNTIATKKKTKNQVMITILYEH
jgi:hypothetical protein